MGHACLEVAEIISSFFMRSDGVREELAASSTNEELLTRLGGCLPAAEAAAWSAERASMPTGVMDQFAQAIRTAVAHDLAFVFTNVPPDDVMGFARERAIEVSFRYTETSVVARIAHTRRHPSYLPAPTTDLASIGGA
jgi:hypothetical protein